MDKNSGEPKPTAPCFSQTAISQDITLTVAEIRERRERRKAQRSDTLTAGHAVVETYWETEQAADLDTLLLTIDSLQHGWQPIETAPTNIVSSGFSSDSGPRFLAWPVKGLVAGARWSQSRSPSMSGGVVGVFVSDWNTQCKPTHWMPLPDTPEVSAPERDAETQKVG